MTKSPNTEKIFLVSWYWDLFGLWELSFGIYDSKPSLVPARSG